MYKKAKKNVIIIYRTLIVISEQVLYSEKTISNFSTNALVILNWCLSTTTTCKLEIQAIKIKFKTTRFVTIKEKRYLSTDEATKSKSGETTGVNALIIQMTNIDLNRSVIL